MNVFLKDFGILAIGLLIGILYKKFLEFYDDNRFMFHEDDKVYEAAEKFAGGTSYHDVEEILSKCSGFNDEKAGDILRQSLPHRTDHDGGYRFFIRSVNKKLGEDVYEEKRKTKHLHI